MFHSVYKSRIVLPMRPYALLGDVWALFEPRAKERTAELEYYAAVSLRYTVRVLSRTGEEEH